MVKKHNLSILSVILLVANPVHAENTDPILSAMWEQDDLGYRASTITQKTQNIPYIADSMANTTLSRPSIVVEKTQIIDFYQQLLEDSILADQSSKTKDEGTDSTEEDLIIIIEEGDYPVEVEGNPDQDLSGNIPRRITSGMSSRCQPLVLRLDSGIFNHSNPNLITAPRVADSLGDTQFINSAYLLAKPRLGQQTCLTGSVGGSLVRYGRTGNDNNYNLLNFSAGVEQELTPNTHTWLGWLQQQFYRDGQRTSLDNSVVFLVQHQEELVENQLWLEPSYILQTTFANPASGIEDLSKISNNLRADLRYKFAPRLFGKLNYQINYSRFTGNTSNRDQTKQRAGAELFYALDPQGITWVNGSVHYLFGSSRDITGQTIDLDNLVVGIRLVVNLSLL